jgi:hypothetical protein
VAVINGVVEVGAAGRGAASWVDARPVPDLDMAAQHRPSEPGGGVLSGMCTPVTAEVLGVLGCDFGHHRSPFTAAILVRGELGEQGGGQV